MKMADDYLPLASSYGGKLFQLVRSSFVDSLKASLKSYYAQLTQVHADTRNLSYNHLSQVDNLREHRAVSRNSTRSSFELVVIYFNTVPGPRCKNLSNS